jgi:hypothetical protein
MAALKSPFSGENMNLQLLVEKIERCEYSELPEDLYSFEVMMFSPWLNQKHILAKNIYLFVF